MGGHKYPLGSCLPSDAYFQIKVQIGHYTIARCIVNEGASISILSARAWRGMGPPILMSTNTQLLYFDRKTSQYLGIVTQTSITLGGKTVSVDFMVIEDPLDFFL